MITHTGNSLISLCLLCLVGATAHAQELLPSDRPIGEVIDHYLDAKLRQAKVEPAPAAPDATIVRRLYLDLAGRIPTAEESRCLLTKAPLAKERLIDTLVKSPEFLRHNANEFDVLLRNDNSDAGSLRPYLLQAFKDNRPWDAMFRDLIGASEPVPATRPDNFVLKRLKDADALTRDVSSVFFGLNIACAQCHRHPHIKSLTQDYFFGMKAFFSYSYDFQGNLLERQHVKLADFKNKAGEVRKPALMFLSGSKIEVDSLPDSQLAKAIQAEDKLIQEAVKTFAKSKQFPPGPKIKVRSRFAEVALGDANRDMFARAIVNRLWFRFYGHGLVMRVDQMHVNNEASHPELLRWLTRDLIAHNYDLKRLIPGLVSCRAYARSSEWKGKEPVKELFAVAVVRPLTAAQWGLSHRVASIPGALKPGDTPELRAKALEGLEAQAVKLFGKLIEQPHDDFQVGITESLKLSNDPALLKATGDDLVRGLKRLPTVHKQIDEAVWAILSRPATAAELELFAGFLDQRKSRPDDSLRQMVWALVNSPEFRFNH